MNDKFKNLETCLYNRLLEINKKIRTLRKSKSYSKEELQTLKDERSSTDRLLSMVRNDTTFNDSNYSNLKEQFINAKIS
jgi:hypothetical protein